MTNEIPASEWKMFFDDLTKRRFDWETKVEVFSEDIGSQVLDTGLSLVGITCEGKGDDQFIEIFVGNGEDLHQTHTIKNPSNIAYLGKDDDPGGIVEIEEADGTKTLVHILEPKPLILKFAAAADKGAS